MSDDGASYWDAKYAARDAAWSGEPNDRIAAAAAALQPGRALDAGCGEGADAIWLAERGWHVTAVDISAVALARGRAMDATGRITWLQADVREWQPPVAAYDLVAAHFVHFPSPQRELVYGRLAGAVRPHGTLIAVAHHPSDLETTARRPPMRENYFTADDLAALLEPAAWDISEASKAPRAALDPQGREITVHDVVLIARRRA
jgi:SAM-dependent methyltransferase